MDRLLLSLDLLIMQLSPDSVCQGKQHWFIGLVELDDKIIIKFFRKNVLPNVSSGEVVCEV